MQLGNTKQSSLVRICFDYLSKKSGVTKEKTNAKPRMSLNLSQVNNCLLQIGFCYKALVQK